MQRFSSGTVNTGAILDGEGQTQENPRRRPNRGDGIAALRIFDLNYGGWPTRCAGSMDAAEYKHVVLGLIFLKYISDAFEEAHAKLVEEVADGADPEDPDEYRAKNIFWVPPEARWPILQSQARQPTIGRTVDDAMTAIERDNPALKDVLPKITPARNWTRPVWDRWSTW